LYVAYTGAIGALTGMSAAEAIEAKPIAAKVASNEH
jgi:hypothetical protein